MLIFDIFVKKEMLFDIHFWGSWSSVIGLILTIVVAIYSFLIERRVRKLKRNFLFRQVYPDLLKDLEKSNSILLEFVRVSN